MTSWPPPWWHPETMLAFGAKVAEEVCIDFKIDANDRQYQAVRAVWDVVRNGRTTINAAVDINDRPIPLATVANLVRGAQLYLSQKTPRFSINTAIAVAIPVIGFVRIKQLAAQFSIEELTRRSRHSNSIETREAAYAAWIIGERATAIELLELEFEPAFLETVLDG